MIEPNTKRRRMFGFAHRLAAALGIGLAMGGGASAQTIPPSQAPAEWVRYAESATRTVTAWVREESEAGIRLRAYLEATREAPDRPTPPVMLRLWIDASGTISRVEFAPFAHDAANADLRSLVLGRKLAGPPPRDMRQPMLLAVQLDVRPPEPVTAAPDSGTTRDRT